MRTTRTRTAALLAAAALSALPALPAAAHDELVSVLPTPESVLETAPEEVELVFTGEVMDLGHQVLVTDSEGRSVTDGPLEQDGTRVRQPLADTGAEDEDYRVVWRVVSSDGHPVEGTFTYRVGAGSGKDPAAAATPGAGDGAGEGAGDDTAEAQGASASASSGVPLWLVAVVGAAVPLAVLGAVALASRRRRAGGAADRR